MKKRTITLVGAGVLLGVGLVFFSQSVLHKTSTTEFCISCHTMQAPYKEYQGTIHFSNNKGVQAQCADCHIPATGIDYLTTKLVSVKDLYHQFITQKIDTPEQYEAHRAEMAERVWQQMKANNSANCRTCHNVETMETYEQSYLAQEKHKLMQEQNLTCIDCHKGIAHFLPETKVDSKAKDSLSHVAQATPDNASIVYPVKTIAMQASKSSENLGTIAVATPLKVISNKDGMREVEIEGYQMAGAEQIIYLSAKQRIILATLSDKGKEVVKPQAWQADEYGNKWRAVSLIAKVSNLALAHNQEPIWKYAENLDNTYCSTCHAKIPASHYNANAWPAVAKSMGARTSITPEELEVLTKYFQYNAKDTAKTQSEVSK